MISEVEFHSFKSFENARLSLGPLTVVVGSNASGKSNVRDGFRFLHGLGRGYSLPDIIGGKYGAGGQVEWTAIRGFGTEIVKFGHDAFGLTVQMNARNRSFHYNIEVRRPDTDQGNFRVVRESLRVNWSTIFTTHPGGDDPIQSQEQDEDELRIRMDKTGSQKKYGNPITVRPERPAISQLASKRNVVRAHKEAADVFLSELAGIRFLDLVPDLMRQPAFPGQLVLGDNGQNLPTVLQEICNKPPRKEVLIDWIKELTPMDVVDFVFPINPQTGLIQLAFKTASGQLVSSYSASDGTLRFLAMLAALLSEQSAGLYFFEEIDNGIHPARLKLLVDFLESQTLKSNIQVVTTTHSPDLLSMIDDQTFRNTSMIFNKSDDRGSIIKPIVGFPEIARLRTEQGLGKLHASGWMEDAMNFLDDDEPEAALSI